MNDDRLAAGQPDFQTSKAPPSIFTTVENWARHQPAPQQQAARFGTAYRKKRCAAAVTVVVESRCGAAPVVGTSPV